MDDRLFHSKVEVVFASTTPGNLTNGDTKSGFCVVPEATLMILSAIPVVLIDVLFLQSLVVIMIARNFSANVII